MNPDFLGANQASSRVGPAALLVRGVGIEPTVSSFRGWRITAFLPPEWTARESHPHFRRAGPAPSCWTSSPFFQVIPDGLEPSLPGCGPGVFAAGPRDHCSSQGGNRTHNRSPGSRPGRFAKLRTRPSSCGGRIRTGVERLMRPCWKPDSSPLRSDQGESRTPTPVKARRSERRVSTCSTTWSISSPYGNRTHPSSLRGWRPFADRRTGRQCVEQELNLHSVNAGGLQPLRLANAQPTHVVQ